MFRIAVLVNMCSLFFKNNCLDIQLYHSETLDLMLRRWAKLEKDFKTKNGRYDISKIPDIYDCIKYDVQHNISLKLENTMELYRLSKALADIVIPQVCTSQLHEPCVILTTFSEQCDNYNMIITMIQNQISHKHVSMF